MAKQTIEKKKVEKLTFKNMKKRHWAGVIGAGIALGLIMGNAIDSEPAAKATPTVQADTGAMVKAENRGVTLIAQVGKENGILVAIENKYEGKHEITGAAMLHEASDPDKSGIQIAFEKTPEGKHGANTFQNVKPGKYFITYSWQNVYIKTATFVVK